MSANVIVKRRERCDALKATWSSDRNGLIANQDISK